MTTSVSFADTLSLPRQTRTILTHLQKRKTISPMEALVSYGCMRLAAQIHRLRKIGFEITTTINRDEAGHPYGRYTLVKAS